MKQSLETLTHYMKLMRWHKPIGIVLLLCPTLWALWMASFGHPQPHIVFVFIAGVILMRSAGCVINDFADRHFDGHVTRTKNRPIVSGRITPRNALILFSVLCLTAFALALTLNYLTILLAIPAVLLTASYPFMKRITNLPQLVLGFAFSWSIPMAFAAQTGFVPTIAWILMATNVFWTIAYDTEYAMVDREDDLNIGIKSTAILFGDWDRLAIAALQILMLSFLFLIGILAMLRTYYYIALLIATLLILYQQFLIRKRDPKGCFRAFLNNSMVGLVIFAGIFFSF